MQYKRAERVSDQIKREVSQIIERLLKDPGIGFVTITDVEMTDDLREAKIFYSVLGNEQKKRDTKIALGRATSFIQAEIGKRIRIKHTPIISFQYDKSIEYGARIEELIKKIHQENEGQNQADSKSDR
jgi:ribosome-binding factor A